MWEICIGKIFVFPHTINPKGILFFLPLIVFFNYIHFEITGDPGNLIGPHRCYSIKNSTFFAPNCTFFLANEKAINQSDLKACLKYPVKLQEYERQLLQLFTNQLSTGSIKYLHRLKCLYLIWIKLPLMLVWFWNQECDFGPNCILLVQ